MSTSNNSQEPELELDGEEEEFEQEGRGRTARKREIKMYELLAHELIAVSEAKCKRLPVTDTLKESLKHARDTKSKAARKRHLKALICALRSREDESEAIRNFLDGAEFTAVTGDEEYRDLEALRAGLCDADTFEQTLEDACQKLPHIDLLLVRELAISQHTGANAKAHKALFRELRRAADESALDDDGT